MTKNGKEIIKTIPYRSKFIDSTRFLTSSLSNLVNILVEEIRKTKCKQVHNDKKCDTCKTKFKDCECFLEYTNFKEDSIEYKCLFSNKNYQKIDANLKKRFFKTFKFSNHDINKFILLLQNGVYLLRIYGWLGKIQ